MPLKMRTVTRAGLDESTSVLTHLERRSDPREILPGTTAVAGPTAIVRGLGITAAGRKVVCIRVPFRAKTFDARTRLRVSLAVALDAGASPRPKSRPIRLIP